MSIEWALLGGARKVLVVAPLSACPDWMRDLELDGQRGVLYRGDGKENLLAPVLGDRPEKPVFVVTNPQSLFKPAGRKHVCAICGGKKYIYGEEGMVGCGACEGTGRIRNRRGAKPEPTSVSVVEWDAVIWDESVVGLANPKSQTNKIAFDCLARTPMRCVLSGEPAPEGPHQFFEQMRFVLGGHFMGRSNFWRWRDDHFRQAGFDWFCIPGHKQMIKDAVSEHGYFLSRKAAGIGEQKVSERRFAYLPPRVRKAYDMCEKHMELPSSEGTIETGYGMVAGNWLRQLSGGYPKNFPELRSPHKRDVVTELCTGELAKEKAVLIFAFNRELEETYKALKAKKKYCAMVTGSTPLSARANLQERFNNGALQFLLMQIKVAKYGIDLSGADTMVLFSTSDSYDDLSQCRDRIVHPTKKTVLSYVWVLTDNTVDEDKYDALADKQIDARMFMNNYVANFKKRRGAA